MGAGNEADFEVVGLYDPSAERAAQRLELLDWLVDEQGFTVEELADAAADAPWRLATIAGDRALRPGVAHSQQDLTELLGIDQATIDEMRRAVGYAQVDPDEPVFTAQDVDAFRTFAIARPMFSDKAVVAFTRTLGSSLARIADAANSMFVADVEGDLAASGATELERAKANLEALGLLDGLRPVIDSIFRRHMQQVLDRSRRAREHITPTSGTDLARMAIGFVDLSGYTSLSRDLDARALSELVERFEVIASDAALAHDGRVIKLVGDAVMYAAVEPDDAVETARDLLVAFSAESHVRAHGGIAFGEVLARGGDYYGPVVNVAARLSEVAVPDEVLVTREVADRVEGLEPAGRRMLKGFDEPVELASLTTS